MVHAGEDLGGGTAKAAAIGIKEFPVCDRIVVDDVVYA